MSRTINLKNNFENFKNDFKKDTGLDSATNMEAYISYVNFRISDYNMQVNMEIMNEISNLPQTLKFHLGQ